MSIIVSQRPDGGLDVSIRTRAKDGTRVRERMRSPYVGRAASARWAYARQSWLERSSGPSTMRNGPRS